MRLGWFLLVTMEVITGSFSTSTFSDLLSKLLLAVLFVFTDVELWVRASLISLGSDNLPRQSSEPEENGILLEKLST